MKDLLAHSCVIDFFVVPTLRQPVRQYIWPIESEGGAYALNRTSPKFD